MLTTQRSHRCKDVRLILAATVLLQLGSSPYMALSLWIDKGCRQLLTLTERILQWWLGLRSERRNASTSSTLANTSLHGKMWAWWLESCLWKGLRPTELFMIGFANLNVRRTEMTSYINQIHASRIWSTSMKDFLLYQKDACIEDISTSMHSFFYWHLQLRFDTRQLRQTQLCG